MAQWGRQIKEPRYKWVAHFEPTGPQRLEGRTENSEYVCLSVRATDVVQAGLLTLDTQFLSVSFNSFPAHLHSPGATQPQPDSICPGKPTISLDEFNHCTLHRVTPSIGDPQACFWKPYPAYVFSSQQSFPGPLCHRDPVQCRAAGLKLARKGKAADPDAVWAALPTKFQFPQKDLTMFWPVFSHHLKKSLRLSGRRDFPYQAETKLKDHKLFRLA